MDQDFDALILEAERRAEQLIAVLRILTAVALVIVFGYVVRSSVAPEETAGGVRFLGARLTMGGYAVIGLSALVLTRRSVHRRWFSYAFVTVDALFVAAAVQMQMVGDSLSGHYVPAIASIWLVPLILSFNALRLSWRVQAYAGIVMVAVLGFLFSQKGLGREGVIPAELYNDFSELANVMRLVMILLACIVLTVAVMRTRRLLRTALDQSRRRALLTSYMPRQIARLIEETDNAELRAGQVITAVVLFVDLRDFTARAETMPPERVSAFLTVYRRLLREAVDEAGGIIDKFVGDGAMVVFARRKPDPRGLARSAIDCSREIVRRVQDWSDSLVAAGRRPVRVGIGVHIGESFVGAVGDEERLEFTVVGDAVNTAARLEEAAKHADVDIVVSRKVLETAGVTDPAFVPLPDIVVRGRQASVPAYAYTAS